MIRDSIKTEWETAGILHKTPMSTIVQRIWLYFCVLLLAAIALAWARSPRFTDSIEFVSPRGGMLISSHPGRLCACWPSPLLHPVGSRRWTVSAASTPRDDALPIKDSQRFDLALMQVESAARPKFIAASSAIAGVLTQYVEAPYWMLLVVPALPPAWMLTGGAWRKLRRRRRALCRECGYDLRASPHVCPECGTPRVRSRLPRYWPSRLAGFVLVALLIACVCRLSRADWHTTSSRPIDFSKLAGFNFASGHGSLADIPPPLRQLDGQRIKVEGFIIPMDQAADITEFALVQSLSPPDCFGPGPPAQQVIIAQTNPGKALRYEPDQLKVAGTLHVRVARDSGYIVNVYEMTVDSVMKAK